MNHNPRTKPDRHPGTEELAPLLTRAEQGDRTVLPQLREALNANADLWWHYGDLATHAEASLILSPRAPTRDLSRWTGAR